MRFLWFFGFILKLFWAYFGLILDPWGQPWGPLEAEGRPLKYRKNISPEIGRKYSQRTPEEPPNDPQVHPKFLFSCIPGCLELGPLYFPPLFSPPISLLSPTRLLSLLPRPPAPESFISVLSPPGVAGRRRLPPVAGGIPQEWCNVLKK